MNQRDMESFAQARAEFEARGEQHPGTVSEEQRRFNHEVVFPELVRRANERDARPNLKLGYSFEDVFGE
jgi:hypothetical protein